jgi:hypothetical protein
MSNRNNVRDFRGGPIPAGSAGASGDFQRRSAGWARDCFGEDIAVDRIERSDRALEEMLELYQAVGNTRARALELVRYVFSRPVGSIPQELGSVGMTLATLAEACGEDLEACAEAELARVAENIEKIRAKRAAQTDGSPLPGYAQSLFSGPDALEPDALEPGAFEPGDGLLLRTGEGMGVPVGVSLGQLQALVAIAQAMSPLLDFVGRLQRVAGAPPLPGVAAIAAEEAFLQLTVACATPQPSAQA